MFYQIIYTFFSLTCSYIIGAIPTGYLFSKYFFNIDITKFGSGNIGATNVARVLGKKYFILIFVIDFLKSFFTLYLISYIFSNIVSNLSFVLILNSITLLFGNAYSVFLNLKGGKGVSTVAGIFAYLFSFKLILIFGGIWILILGLFKRPFLASIFGIYLFCFVYYFFSLNFDLSLFSFLIFACLWITFRHWENIKKFYQQK